MAAYDLDQHEQQETVKIKSDLFESGYITINASAFDENKHELYDMDGLHENAAAEAVVAPKRKR